MGKVTNAPTALCSGCQWGSGADWAIQDSIPMCKLLSTIHFLTKDHWQKVNYGRGGLCECTAPGFGTLFSGNQIVWNFKQLFMFRWDQRESHILLNSLSPPLVQDPNAGDGTAHSGLALPTLINVIKMIPHRYDHKPDRSTRSPSQCDTFPGRV